MAKEKDMEMTKEKAAMEQEQEAAAAAAAQVGDADLDDLEIESDEELDADLADMEETGLTVTRKKFVTTDKKQRYWGYHVLGTVRKRSVQISLTATDAGGYEVLDIVFEDAKEVPLYRSPFVMKDNDGKVTMSGYRYYAVSRDDEGMIYTAQVKPSRKSDQALLEMMIKTQLKLTEGGGFNASAE